MSSITRTISPAAAASSHSLVLTRSLLLATSLQTRTTTTVGLSQKKNFSLGSGRKPFFDRNVKKMQRDAAARLKDSHIYDYLRYEVADSLVSRLEMISSEYTFPTAVEIGSGSGSFLKHLVVNPGIQSLLMCDSSEPTLMRDDLTDAATKAGVNVHRIVCNEEMLPFAPQSIDLVVSSLALHWCNDIDSVFDQARSILKQNGLFVGAVLGGNTLEELRMSLQHAELETDRGVGVHTSPMMDAPDVGNLLTRSGFALPTVDVDRVVYHYRDMYTLMHHLQNMGENNASVHRRPFVRRKVFQAANEYYMKKFGTEAPDGTAVIPATFEVIYFIGWVPHKSQQRPKPRGSATLSLKDIDSRRNFQLTEGDDEIKPV